MLRRTERDRRHLVAPPDRLMRARFVGEVLVAPAIDRRLRRSSGGPTEEHESTGPSRVVDADHAS